MTTIELQKLLGKLYREDYKNDELIAKNILQLGWSLKRLLDSGELSPFDDYEKVKKKIFDGVEWSKTWK